MGMKRKILTGLAIWFGLGVIVCIFIALQPDKKKAETATSVVQESKAEELEKPALSKENNLSESEKITNPLIRNHVGNMRAVLSGNGSGLGYAQVIYIQTEEFEKITGKQLKDFWSECNFEGWSFVYILELMGAKPSGRGMVFTNTGAGARYGFIDTSDDTYTSFGTMLEPVREFFHLKENNGFQYFNSSDSDDEPLRFLDDDDLVFSVN